MPYERADAIIIRYTDFSETSRIFTFYTRRFGRVSALAKGVKRKYSKMIGHVDLLSHSEIIFTSGLSRDRLHILTEANAYETFPNIRKELPRFYAACHAAELVNNMTAMDDPSPELFDQLLDLLRRLDRNVGTAIALLAFEGQLLLLTGFMPQLSNCVSCGKKNRQNTVAFSPRLGGIVCTKCSTGEAELIHDLPADALSLLERLAQKKLTKLSRVKISPRVSSQTRAFLNRYETYILAKKLRTAKHLG